MGQLKELVILIMILSFAVMCICIFLLYFWEMMSNLEFCLISSYMLLATLAFVFGVYQFNKYRNE